MKIVIEKRAYDNFKCEFDTGNTVEVIERETIKDVLMMMYEPRTMLRVRTETIKEIKSLLKGKK